MLVCFYKMMGCFVEVVEVYGKVEQVVNEDLNLFVNYVEIFVMVGGKGLLGKLCELVEWVLKLDLENGYVFFLVGVVVMEVGDNKKGIVYWEILLLQVEVGLEIDQMLCSGIDKMKQGKQD